MNSGKGGQEPVKVCEQMEVLFGNYNILYGDGTNIIPQIIAQTSAEFFKELLNLLSVTLSLRYNNGEKSEKEVDFILSPVPDSTGEFYFSETERKKGKDKNGNWLSNLPVDADANGAYNIARKGLILLNRLREKGIVEFEKSKKVDKDGKAQWLPNKEWLNFIQNQQ